MALSGPSSRYRRGFPGGLGVVSGGASPAAGAWVVMTTRNTLPTSANWLACSPLGL